MSPIDTTVGYALARVARAHRQSAEETLGGLGLHVGQEMLILQLWEEDGQPLSQLAQTSGLDLSTISKGVQRMERSGLVRRVHDSGDARVSRVYLTERGRSARAPVLEVWSDLEARLLRGLTEVEQALLRRLLLQALSNFS